MVWSQVHDPFGSLLLSALAAAVPVIVLLAAIGIHEIRAHIAAMLGLLTALAVAILGFGMPAAMASMSAVYGAGFGLMPIGWIILNVIFLYQFTNKKGAFDGGLYPALRVPPLDRAGLPCRHPRHRPGLRAPVHRDGAGRSPDRARARELTANGSGGSPRTRLTGGKHP
jgi:L-lactate permease